MNFAFNLLVRFVAVLVAAYILPGIMVDSYWTAIVVAIVLGVLNGFFRPILLLLTLPINILTLGLFTFVLNALLVLLADRIVPGFAVANFWYALFFSLVVSLVTAFLHGLKKT